MTGYTFVKSRKTCAPMAVNLPLAAAYGAWGVKKNYGKEYEGLIRSTFVIGPEGSIEKAWHNVRAKGHAQRVVEDL